MTRIELSDLHKSYQPRQAPAIGGLSLTVEPGTLLALLGPSGSGKSTVLKLIAGIEQPDGGEIRFDDRSMLAVPAHRRGAVLMFQKAYLFPFLSVAENIGFGLRARGAPAARIAAETGRMLDLVGLPGFERRRPAQLSGGEQQRVALARALTTAPGVLLLDEPFSSLDPAVRSTLQEAVRRIQQELKITAVLVSHDRAEALAMADRVALLERGRLLAHGEPRSLFVRPPTLRSARQMGVELFLRGEVIAGVLHSPLGPLRLGSPAPPDGPACYAIRPEHLALAAGSGPNVVPALVQAQTFRGEYLELLLEAGGLNLRMRAASPGCAPGDQVAVLLPPEQLFPLVDDESA